MPDSRVAYVGPVAIPGGGAAARRMLGIAAALRDGGFEVLFGSGQLPRDANSEAAEWEGFPVSSIGERTAEDLPAVLKHLVYWRMGIRTRNWLDSLDRPPAAVILYAGYTPYLLRLLPWCSKRSIPLIFDAVEWYEPAHAPGGRFGPYRWNIEVAMRLLAVRAGNVLAISSYLQEYFSRRDCRTIRVPPTLDVRRTKALMPMKVDKGLTVAYAGSPGKKDRIDVVAEAVLRLGAEGEKIRLAVAGVPADNLLALPSLKRRGLRVLPDCIRCAGQLGHDEVSTFVGAADFTVLFRPRRRYAEAGFPTKVVESLAAGTPVICNISSDLGMYLTDGREALLSEDPELPAVISVLRRALALSATELHAMRVSARLRAEDSFDFRHYGNALSSFVSDCITGEKRGGTSSRRQVARQEGK